MGWFDEQIRDRKKNDDEAFAEAFANMASAITGIGAKLNSMVNVVTSGMQTGVSSMVGQNFAAGKIDRVRRANHVGLAVCIVFFVFVGAVTLLFPEQIIGIFTQPSETDVLALARPYMRTAFWLYLAFCLMSTPLGHINGVGFTSLNLVIALLDGVAARIGFSLLLGVTAGMGLEGFWLGSALAGYVSVLLAGIYFFSGKWKTRKLTVETA